MATSHRDARTIDAIVDWFEGAAEGTAEPGGVLRSIWTLDQHQASGEQLERRGYERSRAPDGLMHTMRRVGPAAIDPAGVPDGYVVRAVDPANPSDLERRVEVHRAAFAPSRFTIERYATVRASASYRPDLDVVVEAPDGSFAAYCQCWLDERNGVGEFEPVGTHPDHRRRGLATAACVGALRALHARGAARAIVYHWQADERAGSLYRSLGFEPFARSVRFDRRSNA